MTLDRLAKLTSEHFGVSEDELKSSDRSTEDVSIARHCFRMAAWDIYGYSKRRVSLYENKTHASILHSIKLINDDRVFIKEYEGFRNFLGKQKKSAIDIVVDPNGIQRVTHEAFDERFYKHPEKINWRTGLPYFPAFHFVTGIGAPTPYGLQEWYKQMGYTSDQILERSAAIGSYVHDAIDRMIKMGYDITQDEIHLAFPVAKEAQKVKECLVGFINFMTDEEPIVLASESMRCGEDFGFTMDNMFRLKSDKYKHVWVSDWKTSKVANDDHKMQVEAMRRVVGAQRGLVVVLGNSTKKKYTATKIQESKHDYYWDRFLSIKETAYVDMLDKGQIQPREDNMPSVFSIKDINFKNKL